MTERDEVGTRPELRIALDAVARVLDGGGRHAGLGEAVGECVPLLGRGPGGELAVELVLVRATALDAAAAGFETRVLLSATRPVTPAGGKEAVADMRRAGVVVEAA